jgi:hypothetical protein
MFHKTSSRLVLLVVLLAACLGSGYMYLEHRILADMRDTASASSIYHVETVDFSLWSRKAVTTGIVLTFPGEGEEQPLTYRLKRNESLLPWSYILSPFTEGVIPAYEMSLSEDGEFTLGDMRMSFAQSRDRGVSFDVEALRRFLKNGGTSRDWLTLSSAGSLGLGEIRQIRIWPLDNQGSELFVDRFTARNATRGFYDSVACSGIRLQAITEHGPCLFAAEEAVLSKLDFSLFDQKDAPNTRSIPSLKAPLFKSVSLNKGVVERDGAPLIRVNQLAVAWDSIAPIRHGIHLSGVSLAPQVFAGLPPEAAMFKAVKADFDFSLNETETGEFEETWRADISSLAECQFRIWAGRGENADKEETLLSIFNSQDTASLLFHRVELRLQDKGILALARLLPEMKLIEQHVAETLHAPSPAQRQQAEALLAFLQGGAGPLLIRFAPEHPVPLAELTHRMDNPELYSDQFEFLLPERKQ